MSSRQGTLGKLLSGSLFLILAFSASLFLPVSKECTLVPGHLAANGISSARLSWSATNIYGRPVPLYPWETKIQIRSGTHLVRLLGETERTTGPAVIELGLRAMDQAGEVIIDIQDGDELVTRRLSLTAADGDRDADGMPDRVELTDVSDRTAFRSWFTAIAEAQFYRPDPRWYAIHRDCAGLARFAYKEALRQHGREWHLGIRYLHRPVHPDVRRHHYPQVPLLGERVFRALPGSYRPGDDVDLHFSPSASARVLWEYNTVFVSRSIDSARPGDLLFFRDPQNASPMHTMILLDPPREPDGPRVVYHTGDAPEEVDEAGEVRMVRLADLNTHRDNRWHVRPDNPRFLGFYRWKILEGGRP